jgi:hypothetical protein
MSDKPKQFLSLDTVSFRSVRTGCTGRPSDRIHRIHRAAPAPDVQDVREHHGARHVRVPQQILHRAGV